MVSADAKERVDRPWVPGGFCGLKGSGTGRTYTGCLADPDDPPVTTPS